MAAADLKRLVPPEYWPGLTAAYASAVTRAFEIALILACAACVGAVGTEWRSIKRKKHAERVTAAAGSDVEEASSAGEENKTDGTPSPQPARDDMAVKPERQGSDVERAAGDVTLDKGADLRGRQQ